MKYNVYDIASHYANVFLTLVQIRAKSSTCMLHQSCANVRNCHEAVKRNVPLLSSIVQDSGKVWLRRYTLLKNKKTVYPVNKVLL